MATEVVTTIEETHQLPPATVDVAETKAKKKDKAEKVEAKTDVKVETKTDPDDAPEATTKGTVKMSPEMTELRRGEDKTLKDLLESFGAATNYKCRITRLWPEFVRVGGNQISTKGFLEWVEGEPIDETWLQNRHGGGRYELHFKKRNEKGHWVFGGQITVPLAGTPNTDHLPGAGQPDSVPHVAGKDSNQENPSIVKDVITLMKDQVDKAEARAERAGKGGGVDDAMIAIFREQLSARDHELAQLRNTINDLMIRLTKPPEATREEKLQERLLDKMIDQDTARLQAVRQQYESEIRTIKESHIADISRIRSELERDRANATASHERELSLVRQQYDNVITTLKSSHEVQLQAAKSSFETQTKIMESENRKLDKELDRLQDEVKELRAKKDKTLLEQVKEINGLKDALGVDEAAEQSTGEKIIEAVTNPEAIAAVSSLFQKGQAAAAAPAVAAAQAKPKRQVVKDANGQKFILENGQLRPAKRPPPPGTPPEVAALPPMDPGEVQRVVTYLESAVTNGADPVTVVQSFGAHVPDAVKTAIRDLGGVDQFLVKVAKLPSSSPLLANQAGRNWCKKLGKALVGD